MNSKDFKASLNQGTLSRRQVNKMLASVGILTASMAGVGRSALAAKTLLDMGYPDVASLAGGYEAWRMAR